MYTHVSEAFILEDICKEYATSSQRVICNLLACIHSHSYVTLSFNVCQYMAVFPLTTVEIRSQDSALASLEGSGNIRFQAII